MNALPESHDANLAGQLPHREIARVPGNYGDVAYGAAEGGSGPNSGGLLEYWRILARRKGTLILITFLGGLIGALITLPQTPIYQARTSLEIISLNSNFLNASKVNPVNESGTQSDAVDIQTQLKLLQSASLIDRVLAKLKATEPPPMNTGRIAVWRKTLNLPAVKEEDAYQLALATAVRDMKVRAAGPTRIIEITVDSTNPDTAAAFANAMGTEYIDQSLESRWKATEHTGEWLTRQIEDMRIRLERSEDSLQQYARQVGIIFTDEKTNVSEEKLRQVQQALTASQTDRIAKQSRWEMASASSLESLPDILNDEGLRDYQSKLTELNGHLAELRETFTIEHPKVKTILAQIETLKTALERERGNALKRIRSEYDESLSREKLLAADYGKQRSVVTGEGEKAVHYDILKREVNSSRQLYDTMLQQLKEATIVSALRASNIRIVDPAKRPSRPYKPDLVNNAGIGLLTGLFLAVAIVVMRDRADRTIQEPGEIAFYLNIPELGIIPSESAGTRVRVRIANKKLTAAIESATAKVPEMPALRERVELATWQQRPSMVAESFRATLVSILFSGNNGSRPRVMVISSSSPGEGKSTVVSNLGIAVAEVNQRVLLIDADLRKPRLHEIFDLKNDRGLSDLLRSKEPLTSIPEGMIQETRMPDLYVLTSGSATAAATSLLYSTRMPELLRTLRTEFETIFIDTPPMLQIPDARVLGRMVDRVIMVVRAGKTTRDAAQAAHQRFVEDGTRLLGTILNDWNPKRSPNGYYGNYNGYYGGYQNYYGSKNSRE